MKFGKGDTIGVGILFDSFNHRKVYYTKNGRYGGKFEAQYKINKFLIFVVGSHEDCVHKGMDCFPGVSFSKNSGVTFTVNFAGPFKFDLALLPNYRGTQRDQISTLPREIMDSIAAYATLSVDQVWELRKVDIISKFRPN